jgi:hypothetical protein
MRGGWVLAAAAGGAAVAGAVGAYRWRQSTAAAVRRLHGGPSGKVFSLEQLAGLPPPVTRYFALALAPGAPYLSGATVMQQGEFRIGAGGWSPFGAVQHFAAGPPGFVWDARIRIAPGVAVAVRDSYLDGKAAMEVKLASLIPLVNQRGRAELNQGALLRFLAEAVWLPTALLPGQGITWTPISDHAALATLTDRGNSVSIEFEFGASGEIVRAFTPARFREVAGEYAPTPWTCAYRNYRRVNGLWIPIEGEAGWLTSDGPLSYWRGRVEHIDYS